MIKVNEMYRLGLQESLLKQVLYLNTEYAPYSILVMRRTPNRVYLLPATNMDFITEILRSNLTNTCNNTNYTLRFSNILYTCIHINNLSYELKKRGFSNKKTDSDFTVNLQEHIDYSRLLDKAILKVVKKYDR